MQTILALRSSHDHPGNVVETYNGYMSAIGRVAHELDARVPKSHWRKMSPHGVRDQCESETQMKIGLIIVIILLVLGFWLGSTYIGHRNEMVRKKEAINAAWSQVDVVLQRRADLIPNLVETVKGYASQEVKVFGDIAAARAALMGAKTPRTRSPPTGSWTVP